MSRKRYRLIIDRERCKGCELCVAVCPKKVLALDAGMNSRGQHYACAAAPAECVGCLQCADICPDAAIEIAEEKG
jgi:2-oxoglutarate ferredoxin oxidoreductase subunit delta